MAKKIKKSMDELSTFMDIVLDKDTPLEKLSKKLVKLRNRFPRCVIPFLQAYVFNLTNLPDV